MSKAEELEDKIKKLQKKLEELFAIKMLSNPEFENELRKLQEEVKKEFANFEEGFDHRCG